TRSDALAGGASWSINLFVSVDPDAPASVKNTATVSGGGEINTTNDSASDTAPVTQKPNLSIASNHNGTWHQGAVGPTYTLNASNIGFASTTGTVTVVDTLPAGLTATAINGTGWSCTLGNLTCTRTDALAAGLDYPVITVTVDVAADAAASVMNTATVSGGGEFYTVDDSASDQTTISSAGPGLDLTIQMNDGTSGSKFFAGGQPVHYTIMVQNIGIVDVYNASVQDLLSANLLGATWTCDVIGGAICTASGSDSITDTVNLLQGASVIYHLV